MTFLEKYKDMSLFKIKEEIKKESKAIKELTSNYINFQQNEKSFIFSNKEWFSDLSEIGMTNAEIRMCSLDIFSDEITIASVRINKGGVILPHKHEKSEKIYVLYGEYTDTITGIKYKEGDVQHIPPNQEHGLVSDFALLKITWKPAHPYIINMDDNYI